MEKRSIALREKPRLDTKPNVRAKPLENPRTALGDLKNQCQPNVGLKKAENQKVIKPPVNFIKNNKLSAGLQTKAKLDKKVSNENSLSNPTTKLITKVIPPKPRLQPILKQVTAPKPKVTIKVEPKQENIVIKKECIPDEKPKEIERKNSWENSELTLRFPDVENIDKINSNNPLLLCEYAQDIFTYLQHLELIFPIKKDHLNGHKDVGVKMRAILLDWINDVHRQFGLVQDTFHMTVSIIDRYLQIDKGVLREHLQLVGVTALFIASKYEELMPPELSDFTYITDYTYNKKDIINMEQRILRKLGFNLSPPLAIQFLRRFTKAADATNKIHTMSKYFIELSTIEYKAAHYRPSEIAAASLYLSLLLESPSRTDLKSCWTPTLYFYTTFSADHLLPIVNLISDCVSAAPEAKLKAVYQKYQHAQFDHLSTKLDMAKLTAIKKNLESINNETS